MNSLDRLRELLRLYMAAYGTESKDPLVTFMALALERGSEVIAAAVVEDVRASGPKEAAGLAAIAAEIDADRSAPRLFSELTIAMPRDGGANPDQHLRQDGVIRHTWRYMRESATDIAARPISCKILSPPGCLDIRMLEFIPRATARLGLDLSPRAAGPAGEALRAAAVARASQRTK